MNTEYLDIINAFHPPEFPHATDFFFWGYDDGTEAAAAIDADSMKEIYSKIFDDKAAHKQYQKRIQAQDEKRNEF